MREERKGQINRERATHSRTNIYIIPHLEQHHTSIDLDMMLEVNSVELMKSYCL